MRHVSRHCTPSRHRKFRSLRTESTFCRKRKDPHQKRLIRKNHRLPSLKNQSLNELGEKGPRRWTQGRASMFPLQILSKGPVRRRLQFGDWEVATNRFHCLQSVLIKNAPGRRRAGPAAHLVDLEAVDLHDPSVAKARSVRTTSARGSEWTLPQRFSHPTINTNHRISNISLFP
jgi:hypothetical protein